MKHSNVLYSILGVCLVAVIALLAGCGRPAEQGKIPITTSSDAARKDYMDGRALAEKLRAFDARELFLKAIEKDPGFAMAHYNLALVSTSAKEFFDHRKDAVTHSAAASEGERLLILGFEAGTNGDPVKQREYFEKLVAAFPNDERAHFVLGNHFVGQQEYEKAVAEYQKSTQINPKFSGAYNSMGYAYRAMGNLAEAENAFKKYIELIPDDPNPYDSYAELLMKMGRFDESITNYEKALSVDPNFLLSHVGITANLIFQGKPDQAEQEIQKMYDASRNDGERRNALFTRTLLYIDGGQMDKALAELDKQYALGEAINDVAAMAGDLQSKAAILVEMGKPAEAQSLYERSLTMIQNSDLSQKIKENAELGQHYNLATVALAKRDLNMAKSEAESFKQGAESNQNSNQIRLAHELMGRIALQEKQYDVALTELDQANLLNSYNLYRIGLAYSGMGDKQKAREYFDKAANINTLPTLNSAFIRTKAKSMLAAV